MNQDRRSFYLCETAVKTLLMIFLVLPPDMTDKMMMTANPSQKEVAEDVEDAVLTLMNKYYISVSGNG